jgi:hypothetical protein
MGSLGSCFRLTSLLKQDFLLASRLGTASRRARLLGEFPQTLL